MAIRKIIRLITDALILRWNISPAHHITSSAAATAANISENKFEEKKKILIQSSLWFPFKRKIKSRIKTNTIQDQIYRLSWFTAKHTHTHTPDKLIDSGECNLCAFCAFDLSVFVLFHLQSFFLCYFVVVVVVDDVFLGFVIAVVE